MNSFTQYVYIHLHVNRNFTYIMYARTTKSSNVLIVFFMLILVFLFSFFALIQIEIRLLLYSRSPKSISASICYRQWQTNLLFSWYAQNKFYPNRHTNTLKQKRNTRKMSKKNGTFHTSSHSNKAFYVWERILSVPKLNQLDKFLSFSRQQFSWLKCFNSNFSDFYWQLFTFYRNKKNSLICFNCVLAHTKSHFK